jgi:hypothetical protein
MDQGLNDKIELLLNEDSKGKLESSVTDFGIESFIKIILDCQNNGNFD